jgi:hypothetical protein
MEYKHIDSEPDRRYLFEDANGGLGSATVIEATDNAVRLQWDNARSGRAWYNYTDFQADLGTGLYKDLRIIEQLEPL